MSEFVCVCGRGGMDALSAISCAGGCVCIASVYHPPPHTQTPEGRAAFGRPVAMCLLPRAPTRVLDSPVCVRGGVEGRKGGEQER